ncbi:hypothetical protein N0V83_005551 [Neocucurbitaria cava]|uniref:PAN2 UCH domain-containing protein n=1 Tax=Neocucurbitaria cava TaxID=798079 RepID=A0A9W8Y7L1_9PLEO|nr:hypothetical protein N0V83_005551 [Neocucurbitaria cava]
MPPTTRARARAAGATPLFSLKTDLQRKRDHYGQKLKARWPLQRQRPHRNPRGIHIGPHNSRTRQNVVLQSLMHLPIFLGWLNSHNDHQANAANCTTCALKLLAREYWAPHNANIPFPDTHQALTLIADSATADRQALVDAYDFYEWITAHNQMGDPQNALLNDPRNPWDNEHKALFQLDVKERQQCLTCGLFTGPAAPRQYGIVEPQYDARAPQYQNALRTLDAILADWFTDDQWPENCQTCRSEQPFRYSRTIEAAPQVLRVKVLFNIDIDGHILKQCQPFAIQDPLDLSQHQENQGLPLLYTLSSAIAHGGLGVAEAAEYETGLRVRAGGESDEEEDSSEPLALESDESDIADYLCELRERRGMFQTAPPPPADLPDASDDSYEGEADGDDMFTHAQHDGSPPPFDNNPRIHVAPPTRDDLPSPSPSASEQEDEEDHTIERDFEVPWDNSNGPVLTADIRLENPPDWIVNVRGPADDSHISDDHFNNLQHGERLDSNPQMPGEANDPACWRQDGYQVYILTYTRNKQVGRFGRMERDIPAFI